MYQDEVRKGTREMKDEERSNGKFLSLRPLSRKDLATEAVRA